MQTKSHPWSQFESACRNARQRRRASSSDSRLISISSQKLRWFCDDMEVNELSRSPLPLICKCSYRTSVVLFCGVYRLIQEHWILEDFPFHDKFFRRELSKIYEEWTSRLLPLLNWQSKLKHLFWVFVILDGNMRFCRSFWFHRSTMDDPRRRCLFEWKEMPEVPPVTSRLTCAFWHRHKSECDVFRFVRPLEEAFSLGLFHLNSARS